eukprot:786751-Alexandrium_andersonii.AAC.1
MNRGHLGSNKWVVALPAVSRRAPEAHYGWGPGSGRPPGEQRGVRGRQSPGKAQETAGSGST